MIEIILSVYLFSLLIVLINGMASKFITPIIVKSRPKLILSDKVPVINIPNP